MDKINELTDDLLIKILSFVPTKVAVSTSILSKRWEFLWTWVPTIDYDDYRDIPDSSSSPCLTYRDIINKNMPLHRAPVIEILRLGSICTLESEDIKRCVGMAVSRCVRDIYIDVSFSYCDEPHVVLSSSLYTCKSLVTLELEGVDIIVDVPQKGCLPSLKVLKLLFVTYLNEDCLGLLLSYCPVLENLVIDRHMNDNMKALVVIVPSLQRLSLKVEGECSSDEYVIDTPSLKYFEVEDHRDSFSYVIKHMPKLEEACIVVEKDLDEILKSITSVKRLSLQVFFNNEKESMYSDGIVFNQLEHLKLSIRNDYWSKLLVRLLTDSPKLRVLNLRNNYRNSGDSEPISWSNEQSSVPKCLLNSLTTFEFEYRGRPEERDFLSFIFKNAHHLKSTSIFGSSYE